FFLGLKILRVVKHLAVTVSENIGRIPAMETDHSRFQTGGEYRLHQCLPGLKILAADRHTVLFSKREQGRNIGRQVWSSVCKGYLRLNGRVGVNHRRCDIRVAVVKSLFKRLDGIVYGGCLEKDLGRCSPDHYEPRTVVFGPKTRNVLDELLGQLHFVSTLFNVVAMQSLYII